MSYREGNSKQTKGRACVLIPMTLSKITLVFFTVLDYKLYQKIKNDQNDVKLWIKIVNPFLLN